MKSFPFKKIDAFAKDKSSGNPAGYIGVPVDSEMSENEMQAIAYELRGYVNEVGFLQELSDKEFRLKYYSAEREVEFCGHATIGIMYDLIKNNEEFLQLDYLTIHTNKGRLQVENRIAREGAVFIKSPKPRYLNCNIRNASIAQVLEIKEDEIGTNITTAAIDAGLRTLLVPIKSLNAVLDMNPNLEILKKFCLNNSIDIIEVFTEQVCDSSSHYRTRVFAPTFGYLEDPATGSGNSALGYLLLKNYKWETGSILIEQNGQKEGYNRVILRKTTDEEGIARVWFGGGAITRIEGVYNLF